MAEEAAAAAPAAAPAAQEPAAPASAAPEQGQSSDASQGSDTSLINSDGNNDGSQASDPGQEGQGSEGAGSDGNDDAGSNDENASGAPDAYADFTLPEGVTADGAALDQATPLFKEMNLSQEQSQKLVDFYAERMSQTADAQQKAFTDMTEGWANETRKDPDIGGDKLDASVATAKMGIEKLGSPELSKLLDSTGLGNHPAMLKFALNVGNLMKEDTPGSTSRGAAGEKSLDERLYPNG